MQDIKKVKKSVPPNIKNEASDHLKGRDAVIGWAGWALAYPEFGLFVNPIPTKGDRLCPKHYCLPTRI